MRLERTLLLFVLSVLAIPSNAQSDRRCCDQPSCQTEAIDYAKKMTGLVDYLGICSTDPVANDSTLNRLRRTNERVYTDLLHTARSIADRYIDHPRFADSRTCFFNSLPSTTGENVMAWINYFRPMTPQFPSSEFCGGWRRRIEVAQGAAAFLSKSHMAYLGAIKGYLGYTFSGKTDCGGRFRLFAGPALFLRSKDSYFALSTKLNVRIKDIGSNVFSLGNLNAFAGYNSNFRHFNYVEAGLEAELGSFGVNIAANFDTQINRFGFLVGFVLANKNL